MQALFDLKPPSFPHVNTVTGGAKKTTTKSKTAAKKSKTAKTLPTYKPTSKKVVCGDGKERTLYKKGDKLFIKKKSKTTGKIVFRPAPKV